MKSSFDEFLKRREVQQPVHNGRCPLTYRQEAPGVKEKIESMLSRLGRLTAEDGTFGDQDESKRKLILFEYVLPTRSEREPTLILRRALEVIKDVLCKILKLSNAAEYKDNEADARVVCELAEDVRDAVIEYQVSANLVITLRMGR